MSIDACSGVDRMEKEETRSAISSLHIEMYNSNKYCNRSLHMIDYLIDIFYLHKTLYNFAKYP